MRHIIVAMPFIVHSHTIPHMVQSSHHIELCTSVCRSHVSNRSEQTHRQTDRDRNDNRKKNLYYKQTRVYRIHMNYIVYISFKKTDFFPVFPVSSVRSFIPLRRIFASIFVSFVFRHSFVFSSLQYCLRGLGCMQCLVGKYFVAFFLSLLH